MAIWQRFIGQLPRLDKIPKNLPETMYSISPNKLEEFISCAYKYKNNVFEDTIANTIIFNEGNRVHNILNAYVLNEELYNSYRKLYKATSSIDQRKYMLGILWQFSIFYKKFRVANPEVRIVSMEDKMNIYWYDMEDQYKFIMKWIPDFVWETDDALIIRDYKTSKTKWSDKDVIYSKLQWKLYPVLFTEAYKLNKKYIELWYIVFPKEWSEKIQIIKTRVNIDDGVTWDLAINYDNALNSTRNIIQQFHRSHVANFFDTKVSYKCSYCPLKKICPAHNGWDHHQDEVIPGDLFDTIWDIDF